MTDAVFQAPKRRVKVFEAFAAALPVCVSAEDELHNTLRAEVISQHVIVSDPAHAHTLYERGFFGKGVFSRARPQHSVSQQWKYVGDRRLPVLSSAEYQKRLRWARAALLMQGLDDESVDQALQILTKPVELDVQQEQSQEPVKSPAESIDSLLDQSVHDETGVNPDQRQGNPLHDPLAERYPQEPERLERLSDPAGKCRRHDDWVAHCGCRPEEDQRIRPSADPSDPDLCVLVQDSDEDAAGNSSLSMGRRGECVCRINPFPMMEFLQLSYEEAFFLVYALGCLSVHHSGELLSVAQLWTMFRSLQPNFCSSYAAYHYFRSKGWVPKTGIKYGTDFMLYRKGPPFYHASYSVVVERVDACFSGAARRPFSWRSLAALSRTTGNVSKELMLCYVVTPPGLTEEGLSSPECLQRFSVQEVLVSRWVSSRERTEQEDV